MKKRIILALALILTLAACGGNTAATGGDVPNGEVTGTPPQTQEPTPSNEPSPAEPTPPDPSQEPDASVLVTPPTPPTPAADISELIFSADTMGLSAEMSAEGTITYTYTDTSIKPSYSSGEEVFYIIWVYGMNANGRGDITTTYMAANSTEQGDGTHVLDMESLIGWDGQADGDKDFPVTVDENGLTATWKSAPAGEGELDSLGSFAVSIELKVGDTEIYEESTEFGMDILK